MDGGLGPADSTKKEAGTLIQKTIRTALLKAMSGSAGDCANGEDANSVDVDGAGASRSRLAGKLQQGLSLQETIQAIIDEAGVAGESSLYPQSVVLI